jgi:hypothetical protein
MNPSEWFIDTDDWLAWLNRDGDLHERAHRFDARLPAAGRCGPRPYSMAAV